MVHQNKTMQSPFCSGQHLVQGGTQNMGIGGIFRAIFSERLRLIGCWSKRRTKMIFVDQKIPE